MALSASLFLRQNQSLVMTPQLMQSIQLLQMTHVELSQFIAQEVEKNPLLEFPSNDGEAGGERGEAEDEPYGHPPEDAGSDDGYDNRTEALSSDWYDNGGSASTSRLNDELDANYTNVFPDDSAPQRLDAPELVGQWKSMPGSGGEGADYDLDDFVAGQVSLRDHLAQQIPFVLPDVADRLIAQNFVDQLDDAGYLQVETGERLGTSLTAAERVLAALQTLDPPGVFARSLAECLAIQLRQKDRYDPAMQALVENLELLARRDFATLKRLCGVDEEDLLDMLGEIRQLNPKPGSGFEAGVSEAIMPDVVVRVSSDTGWLVELNPDTLPRVLVNQSYFSRVTRNGEDHAFLSDCLQSANWLTRSLDQRAKTIMKVASEIVRQQDAFLLYGVDHLRPLNLKTVAEAIKMHESTVSRVTSNKYMLTPRGLFELKYFFTVSISAVAGGDSHSAEAVRHKIRALIMQESPDAVLSDDDIVDMLKKGGVDLARRTVAKYREAMNIASSVQRRREKRALAKVAGF
ncbi:MULTISPECIES: RNA polymerase factor sigma-54 [unclassified Rhizobium]|uniref:RNA polymerase factor sigma-54 n=1 Tax=unclassified Rhizobium TaxID=2613769 RepID=UPI001A97FF48|nr:MULTISPECIES: RNA polymerase factor sigma-54 [unclassified Rhizobium]MBX5160899.1 RNA polymerase factor sigma-54 [Rhizobium sp. NZLR8]MBX5165887.1 RNA polymerase factor sigma-54 [Rhizobium sp. NZLR4b]MBX5174304.1 RNA polymerase factor sigma-54 [Rhizobium sp. NZLR1b]MBX5184652.1 RNA polymerase factor sigma-54 [Rhizobium sp. NZLR5]MBX5193356.1 RNA polymerase factor sigma-54 [Rhizobium sp. NZLR3b]